MFNTAISPTGWGAQINYDTKDWGPWYPDKWVLHWPGSEVTDAANAGNFEAEAAHLRGYEAYHLSKKWAGIAYNYAIGQSGYLYRLRGENRSAATSGDIEEDGIPENYEARAVLFIIGDGVELTVPAKQTFASIYYADPMLVIGHKDVRLQSGTGTVTSCPGDAVYQFIQDKGWEEYDVTAYRGVQNVPTTGGVVPDWVKDVIDDGITAGVIRVDDDSPDDWERSTTDGRLWAFLDRAGWPKGDIE